MGPLIFDSLGSIVKIVDDFVLIAIVFILHSLILMTYYSIE